MGIDSSSTEFNNLNHKHNIRGSDSILRTLLHVHGTTSENMVLGVNHKEQINNESFMNDIDITSQFIKPECNLAQRHGVELKCQKIIKDCDLIVIFGSSLGKTDELWWELIANEIRERNCRLLIFIHNENIKKRNPSRSERDKRALFNRMFGERQPENINEKVIVSFNSDIFNFKPL